MKKRIIGLTFCAVVCLMQNTESHAFVINTKGGDCKSFGTWDLKTKTCTLTRNVSFNESTTVVELSPVIIQIAGRGITLDGNGKTIYGSGTDSEMGVYISGQRGVTVKNINITGTAYGVTITGASTFNKIMNAKMSNNMYGASIDTNSNDNSVIASSFDTGQYGIMLCNYVERNSIDSSTFSKINNGIMLYGTVNNSKFTNNTLSGNTTGAYIGFESSNNVFTGNTFEYNSVGLMTVGGINNSIYRNNFIGRTDANNQPLQTLAAVGFPNALSQALPIGGNFWSYYDADGEGCVDMNSDNVCDQPYVNGNIDEYPWKTLNGWIE